MFGEYTQEQRLLTWAEGKYGRIEITTSLRRLEKKSSERTRGRAPISARRALSFVLDNGQGNNYDLENQTYQTWRRIAT